MWGRARRETICAADSGSGPPRRGGHIGRLPSTAKGESAMKALRALTLVLALIVCAHAGNIPNMGAGTPPPPSSAAGHIPNDATGDADPGGAGATPMTEVMLSLLQSAMALF